MKDELRNIVEDSSSQLSGMNKAREYLQSRILLLMMEAGAMIPLAFCGGTALRFLYRLPRFSEDLDFSMEKLMDDGGFGSMMDRVRRGLVRQGYDITVKNRKVSAVDSYLIKFSGLAHELGLSPRKTRMMSIKVEVDTNPPEGAVLDISVVRRFTILRLQHHDRSSLLAGKLHAVLTRGYPKGRDYYDLLWYMTSGDWPRPNMTMLQNALRQTGWQEEELRSLDIRAQLEEKFQAADWPAIRRDIAPFLENPSEAEYLNRSDMVQALSDSSTF